MMTQIDFDSFLGKIFENFEKKIDRRVKAVAFSSIVWGILAHGMTFFNKYSIFDDSTALFGVGRTYTSGRWMLGILDRLYLLFFGDSQYSIPLVNGLVSILYIAVSAYLIVLLFDIKRTGTCISITGVLITFPVIMGIFGYMYTAPYYMLAVLFAVSGVFLTCKKQNILGFLSGTLLMCFSIGIYQAFISVFLSLLLIYYISMLSSGSPDKPKRFIVSGIYFAASAIFSLAEYFCLNKLILSYYNLSLSSYRGIDTIGSASPGLYLSRIGSAYQYFFSLDTRQSQELFPFNIKFLYVLTLVLSAVLSIKLIIKAFRTDIIRGVLMTISVLLLPAAFNFIYIMCEAGSVYILMSYGQSMLFVFLAWLIDKFEFNKVNLKRAVYGFGASVLLLVSCFFCRYDNIYYLKAEFEQQRAISYFTVMVAQIKSTDGYKDELPVVYINDKRKTDLTVHELDRFAMYSAAPNYNINSVLNDYAWTFFVNNWCAFYPELGNAEDFEDLPEVIEMPCYPDDGSIRIINDTIVVKFSPVDE